MAIVTLAVSSERLGRPVVGGRPRTGYEVVRLAGVWPVVHLCGGQWCGDRPSSGIYTSTLQ